MIRWCRDIVVSQSKITLIRSQFNMYGLKHGSKCKVNEIVVDQIVIIIAEVYQIQNQAEVLILSYNLEWTISHSTCLHSLSILNHWELNLWVNDPPKFGVITNYPFWYGLNLFVFIIDTCNLEIAWIFEHLQCMSCF